MRQPPVDARAFHLAHAARWRERPTPNVSLRFDTQKRKQQRDQKVSRRMVYVVLEF